MQFHKGNVVYLSDPEHHEFYKDYGFGLNETGYIVNIQNHNGWTELEILPHKADKNGFNSSIFIKSTNVSLLCTKNDNQEQEVLPRVLQELEARKQKGLETYGTTLKTHNNRSALRDALDEALDLVMYLTQALMEEEEKKNDK